MKSIEAQLRKYREAAVLRATPGEGPVSSHNARKRWLRAREATKQQMRGIAEEVCGRGVEAQRLFTGLLSEREPSAARRWAAFHVLELCSLPAEVEAEAMSVIEAAHPRDSKEWQGDQVWLRRWRAARGSRADLVRELCRCPVDWKQGQWSMFDLLRATRYEPGRSTLTAAEVAECLRTEPNLVEEWLGYSQDQRGSPAWFVAERAPGRFEVGRLPSGDQLWFTDRIEAVAAFVVRALDEAG